MRPAHGWPSAVLLITLLVLLSTATATAYVPGVQPGDWAKYGDISATWQSEVPGLNPPDPIYVFLVTQSVIIAVTDVSGTTVTFSGTAIYLNGTSTTEMATGDIRTGMGDLSFWVLSAGLSPGDPIFDTAGAPTINYTTTQTFAGVLREAVVLDVNATFGNSQFTILGLWDRNTGILLQLSYAVFYDYFGQTASGTAMATLTETNLWYAGTPHFIISANPVSLTFDIIPVAGIANLTLTSLGDFSGLVSIAAHITPVLVNGPMVQVDPENVTLGLNSTARPTLFVLIGPDAPLGHYIVNVTATDGTQVHTVFVPVTIGPVAGPDFALTIPPEILYVRSGLSNSTLIFLRSVDGFSGTVQLAVGDVFDNSTGTFGVSIDPAIVGLSPGSGAVSTITVSTGPNSAGTIIFVVTGTSGSLQHSATLTAVILPGGPTNHPPVAVISSPAEGFVGTGIPFNGLGSYDPDGFIQSYDWNFGDGITSFGCCVSHTYFSPGTYTVSLTVTDNLGATSTATTQILIRQQLAHDVAIADIQFNPMVVVQGQYVGILAILQNRGSQSETVSLEVFADSTTIASQSNIFMDATPYGTYVFLNGDTENLAPGTYTTYAYVFLATDENPSDNTFVNGQLTVLPPPIINVTPDAGSLGTQVTVQGSGFPPRPSGYGPVPILVSFDDQFMGFSIPRNGTFSFTLNIPHAQPGPHEVKALDTFSGVQVTTSFTVTEGPSPQPRPQLEVSVEAGVIYFPGETAVIHVQTALNGVPTSPNGTITATLYKPDGSTQQLNLTPLGNGIYKAQYAVPRASSLGTYLVVVTAGHDGSSASGMVSLEVKPTWISANGPRLATASVAVGGIVLAVGLSWRRGLLRKRTEVQRDRLISALQLPPHPESRDPNLPPSNSL